MTASRATLSPPHQSGSWLLATPPGRVHESTAAVSDRRKVRFGLAPEPTSAGAGRDFLRAAVAGWGLGLTTDQLDVLQLLTSELITNSLIHARSEMDVIALQEERDVRVAVRDLDDRWPVLSAENLGAMGGRGLILVNALADDWGVVNTPYGKAVWFRLRIPTSLAAAAPR